MRQLCIALIVALALTGCSLQFSTPKDPTAPLDRRDAEQVLADRDRMVTEISAALARVAPGTQWRAENKELVTGCGEGHHIDGNLYFSPRYGSELRIPEARWDQAVQTVIDIAAKYGYTDVFRGTEHVNLQIEDADGNRLLLLTGFFTVDTECLMTAEEKREYREYLEAKAK